MMCAIPEPSTVLTVMSTIPMIAAIVKLKPKKLYRSNIIGQPTIDACQTAYRTKNDEFIERFNMVMHNEEEHKAHAKWGSLKSTIYDAAIQDI